jgi:hypothetical protein
VSAPGAPPLAPVAVRWRDGRPLVDLCPVVERFRDPFYDDTITRALARPFALLCRREVPIEELDAAPAAPPAGFVFHLSRCGSTLITRMLAAVPGHVVASEPSLLELLLDPRAPAPWDEAARIRWLRAVVTALGWRRFGDERRLFVKLAPWLTLLLPLVRRAFPAVPWIFVVRDPVEVMVSNLRTPGGRIFPGALDDRLVGVPLAEAVAMSQEEYLARLLGRLCEAALAHLGDGGRVVDYRDLPACVTDELPAHFGLGLDAHDRDRMRAVTGVHAKAPHLPWREDSAAKQRAADAEVRDAAARWVAGPYARLLAARARG